MTVQQVVVASARMFIVLACLVGCGCSSRLPTSTTDGGSDVDAGADRAPDAGRDVDAGADRAPDAGSGRDNHGRERQPRIQCLPSEFGPPLASFQHTCALLDSGAVKCWGRNDYGQLGPGEVGGQRGSDPREMGDNLPAVDLGTGRTAVALTTGGRPHLRPA